MKFLLPHLFPDEASALAPRVDQLYFFLVFITAFFTLVIFLLVVYFGIRYRRRSEEDQPGPVVAHLALEVAWTGIPFIIVMVLFFWASRLYFVTYRPPANAMEIHVVGKQWMWKIQHPDGRREINELHVPVGQPVKIILASQDVVHDFSIPEFRIKQDAVPGRYTVTWFIPTRVGQYHLFCAEYCGTQHSGMIGRVVVMEPEKYQEWLAGTAPDELPAMAGGRLFTQLGCNMCHGTQAPTLAGLYQSTVELSDGSTVRADEAYIRESILDSGAKIVKGYPPIMPSYRGQITEEQLFDLIEYIKSLKNPGNVDAGLPQRPQRPAPTDVSVPGGPISKDGKASQGPLPRNEDLNGK